MINKLEFLIKRAQEFNVCYPIEENDILSVETSLNITLPIDFKKLSQICSYEYFSCFDTCNFGLANNYSVIKETKYYRDQYNLPHNYVLLSFDDVDFILLKITSSDISNIIWCDEADFFNLCEGKPFEYNPTIFPSFTDFFEFLVNEEEKIQKEEEED